MGGGGRWVKAGSLKYGTRLRTPGGRDTATVTGGWIRAQRDGWMWDLTVPGNNDHDFYINTVSTDILVHNACSSTSGNNSNAALGRAAHDAFSNMLEDSGDGYSGAQRIEGTSLRVDGAYDDPVLGKQVPIELKPDTPAQLGRGWNQLGKYEQAMDAPAGSGQLWTWSMDQIGNFVFRRVL